MRRVALLLLLPAFVFAQQFVFVTGKQRYPSATNAKPAKGSARDAAERLPLSELAEDILGVTVRKVVIPVAAGRNLAVLLEAAVRNYILQLRGKDSAVEFLAQQKQAMEDGE